MNFIRINKIIFCIQKKLGLSFFFFQLQRKILNHIFDYPVCMNRAQQQLHFLFIHQGRFQNRFNLPVHSLIFFLDNGAEVTHLFFVTNNFFIT